MNVGSLSRYRLRLGHPDSINLLLVLMWRCAQINMKIGPIVLPRAPIFGEPVWFKDMQDLIMPFVWLDKHGGITDKLAKQLKDDLVVAERIEQNARWVAATVGGVLAIVGAILLLAVIRYATVLGQYTSVCRAVDAPNM